MLRLLPSFGTEYKSVLHKTHNLWDLWSTVSKIEWDNVFLYTTSFYYAYVNSFFCCFVVPHEPWTVCTSSCLSHYHFLHIMLILFIFSWLLENQVWNNKSWKIFRIPTTLKFHLKWTSVPQNNQIVMQKNK
jgi:hypothetical protein